MSSRYGLLLNDKIIMKRIFFLLYSMNVGGVEKSLLSLLSVMPLDRYEVHVGLIHKEGGFLTSLPNEVIVHEVTCYEKYWDLINDPPLWNIKKMLKGGHYIDAFVHLFLYLHYKLTSTRYWFYKYILRNEPQFPIEFDLAVSFAGPSQMMDYYICEKVRAKKKCGWIHFDVSKIDIDKGMTKKLYKQFDKVFIVSEGGKEIFDRMFPEFSSKTELFHNIVSPNQIIQLSQRGPSFDDSFDGKRILTVGRLSEEKGQLAAIKALKILRDKGCKVRWYFVGDGKIRDDCVALALECGISDAVVFLGTQTNPYGYMRDCDVYVQPSRHEGFCITLAEALCFNKPIVATNFTGAAEQLKNRLNSIVVGPSVDEIANGIIEGLRMDCIDTFDSTSVDDLSVFLNLLQ